MSKKVRDYLALIISILALIATINIGVHNYNQQEEIKKLQEKQIELEVSVSEFNELTKLYEINEDIVKRQENFFLDNNSKTYCDNKTLLVNNRNLLNAAKRSLFENYNRSLARDRLNAIEDCPIVVSGGITRTESRMSLIGLSPLFELSIVILIILLLILSAYIKKINHD